MAIKVKVPLDTFNGYRGGVYFKNGIGEFEDEEYGRYIAESLGYEIIEEKKTEKKAETKKSTAKKTTKRKTTTKKDKDESK